MKKKRIKFINFGERLRDQGLGSFENYMDRIGFEICAWKFPVFANKMDNWCEKIDQLWNPNQTTHFLTRFLCKSAKFSKSADIVSQLWFSSLRRICSARGSPIFFEPISLALRGWKVPYLNERNVQLLPSQASNYRITHFSNSAHILIRICACVTIVAGHFIYLFVFIHYKTIYRVPSGRPDADARVRSIICSWQRTPKNERSSCRRRRRRTHAPWLLLPALCSVRCSVDDLGSFDSTTTQK